MCFHATCEHISCVLNVIGILCREKYIFHVKNIEDCFSSFLFSIVILCFLYFDEDFCTFETSLSMYLNKPCVEITNLSMPIKRNYVILKMVNDSVVMQVLCFNVFSKRCYYLEERYLDDAKYQIKRTHFNGLQII